MDRDRSRDAEGSLWSGVSERPGELLGDNGMDNSLQREIHGIIFIGGEYNIWN